MRAVLIGLAAFATGCAQARPTSVFMDLAPRAQVAETGERVGGGLLGYRYGYFCGQGNPSWLTKYDKDTQRTERLTRLKALTPQDAIDASCRLHDVCYETLGHDTPACDIAFQMTLGHINFPSTDIGKKCWNLAFEIQSGMGFKRRDRSFGLVQGADWVPGMKAVNTSFAQLTSSVGFSAVAAQTYPRLAFYGYPSIEEQGQCRADNEGTLAAFFTKAATWYQENGGQDGTYTLTIPMRGMIMEEGRTSEGFYVSFRPVTSDWN